MKNIVLNILTFLALKILEKYQPVVIGVTGSYGKTSTKEAIVLALQQKFRARGSSKNYNNEFGVPLTIIGVEGGGRSSLRWLAVILRAVFLLLWKRKSYPEMLVLEMGADRPGDIEHLVKLAPCHVGVVTAVGPVHIESFGTEEKIAKEKSAMVRHLGKEDIAILNADDKATWSMQEKTKARVCTYGFREDASVRALELEREDSSLTTHAMRFKLHTATATVPVALTNLLGKHQVYPVLAAAAVGQALGMNLVEISKGLAAYSPPPGRMRLLDGIKHTLLIDDTYNASPESMRSALVALQEVQAEETRKIAVLGDMLELGKKSDEAHHTAGKQVVNSNIDRVLTVGEQAEKIAQSAKENGMPEDHIHIFATAERAGRFLQQEMREGDIVLLKGSQGVHIERVVKEVMAEPLRAKELLVRQGKEWE